MSHPVRLLMSIVVAIWIAQPAAAQMITTTVPFQNNSDSFFESFGMNWSLSGPGFSARFGNPGLSRPQFGGFVPGAGLSTGFQINGGGFTGNFNFDFSQGSTRSSVTTAPVLTTTSGVPGFLIAGQQRNFVTGLVPVVGNGGGFFYVPSTSWAPAGYFNGFNPGYGPQMMPPTMSPSRIERFRRGEMAMQDGRQLDVAPRADAIPADDELRPAPREGSRPPAMSAAAARQQLVERKAAELAAAGNSAAHRSREGTTSRSETASSRESADRYLDRARKAEAAGQPSTALIYYRLAAKHADAAIQADVDAAVRRLETR